MIWNFYKKTSRHRTATKDWIALLQRIMLHSSSDICRAWCLGIKEINMLAVWERKFLWRIFGYVMKNNKWRSRINTRLRPTYKQQKLIWKIKTRRLWDSLDT
jgi:hypothetical protein